jgi:lipopolysaccharide export system protein LptA
MSFVDNKLPRTFTFALGLALLFGAPACWALPSDREQPIRVQADSAELDEKQGVAVYRGGVVITQGTLKITGDTVTITQDAQGDIEVFTAVGNPAYYEQLPAENKSIVKAYGRTIQYFAPTERIVLIDEAKVIQEGNTFQGEKIVYDTVRQIVNAGRAQSGSVTTPRPRVDMVIQPKKKPAAQQAP